MNTLTNAPLADLLQRLFAEAEASAPGDSPALADLSEAELKRLMGSKTEYREFYGRLKDLALPVSRETGCLLYMLARSSSARSIVEFGTSFGLSTLHQLRGRVGRGPGAAVCLLATRLPDGYPSLRRLEVLAQEQDGMRIAQEDLAQRGVGDVLGAAQSGLASGLHHVDVIADAPLIAVAADAVAQVMAAGPGLSAHPALAAEVARWEAEHLTAADYLEKG